jgi:oxygen-dependent protoporphyrinogen oxidase
VKETQVLIIGGGISGLSCAYTLARGSVDFLLLEKQSRLGGTIRTETIDDFLLDTGPDAFLTQKPEALALCRELGLESKLIPTNPSQRTVFVLNRGRLHPLPEGMVLTVPTRILPFAFSSLFSLRGKLRMGLEFLVRPRDSGDEESISSFIERRLGREALERLAEPLLAGIHSGDPDRLSMDQLFPRFVALEKKYGSLIRGMRRVKPRGDSRSPTTVFMSLAGGLVELVEALEEKLPTESVLLGKSAYRVRKEGERYVVETSSGEQFSSRALVISLPMRDAGRLAEDVSSDLAENLSGYKSVSTAVVSFRPNFPTEHPTPMFSCGGFSVVPGIRGSWTAPTKSSSSW